MNKTLADNNMEIETNSQKNPIEIGMLEIRRHIPILYSFSKICKLNNTNVTIFTTKKLFNRLITYLDNWKDYNIILKKDRETIHSYIKRVETICNKNNIDLLFINTIHETFFDLISYIKFNPKSKIIFTVHHVNSWLKPKLVFDIKHPLITIDTNISSALIYKYIFPKFDAINVIYKPLKDYIESSTNFKREIFTIPTSIFEEKKILENQKNDKKLRITIPGLIQEHRKDYSAIFPAINKLFDLHQDKIELYVLGYPIGRFGKKIYDEFNNIKQKGNNIIIFNNFIPDKQFNNILNKTDVILAPIKIKTRADGIIQEEYGKTVGSGVVFNAIQYAKPIIVPAEFNMLPELKSSTLKYADSKELESILTELILNSKKLNKIKKGALINAKLFSLNNIQTYFKENILSWILS